VVAPPASANISTVVEQRVAGSVEQPSQPSNISHIEADDKHADDSDTDHSDVAIHVDVHYAVRVLRTRSGTQRQDHRTGR
jgi:hypothetical protein